MTAPLNYYRQNAERGGAVISNADRARLSSAGFEGRLAGIHVLLSMNGKVRWVDSMHGWQEVVLQPQEREREARRELKLRRVQGLIAAYVEQHNSDRLRQSLNHDVPAHAALFRLDGRLGGHPVNHGLTLGTKFRVGANGPL